MYVQGVDNVFELRFNDSVKYGEVFLQAEREYSAFNFEAADTDLLFRHFADAEAECRALLAHTPPLVLPAYDQCLKASHLFNLLDARGVISVTERAAYIGRVRVLARACCTGWLRARGHLAVEAA
jgi:glycyl-tRNA synthetase alpha chain